MKNPVERPAPVSLSNEAVAILVAVAALSRAIDRSGRLNRETISTMRTAAGLAKVNASMREAVLAAADFMEAGHG